MAIDTMQPGKTTSPQPAASAFEGNQESQFWCNFCDFRTNDANAYLAHSCADVLAARGVEVKPTGGNECR